MVQVRDVSAYTVVRVSCVSLHCYASERHVSAYTVVQVRDMLKLTL